MWRPCHLLDEYNHLALMDYPVDTTSAGHHNGLTLAAAPALHLYKIIKLARRVLKEFSNDLSWYHFMNIAFMMHLEHLNNNFTWDGDNQLEGLFEFFQVLEELLQREHIPQYFNPGINLMCSVKHDVALNIIKRLKDFRDGSLLLITQMKRELNRN